MTKPSFPLSWGEVDPSKLHDAIDPAVVPVIDLSSAFPPGSDDLYDRQPWLVAFGFILGGCVGFALTLWFTKGG